jgi:hypothetical protein
VKLSAAVLAVVAVWPGVTHAVATIMGTVEAKDYLFEDDKLVLSLNKVASERSMKGYTVGIPYAALKGILRADGPLGSLQK